MAYKGKLMKDNIAEFLGISYMPDSFYEELEESIKLEKEKFNRKSNFSQKGDLNNFFGEKHTDETKRKMSEKAKTRISNRIGKKHTEESKIKMSERALGRKLSDETKLKMSLSKLNINKSEETKIKISLANKGKSKPPGFKEKMSEIAKNRKRTICEHCNLDIDVSNYKRWHGDNCRVKQNVI